MTLVPRFEMKIDPKLTKYNCQAKQQTKWLQAGVNTQLRRPGKTINNSFYLDVFDQGQIEKNQ